MMDFIMVPLIIGICVAGVYGLFELFVRRKERLTIIEKISEKLDASTFEGKLDFGSYWKKFSFSALKAGCLMAGTGLGLLVGFIINNLSLMYHNDNWYRNELAGTAYGASVLLFGGISLIIAFVIEMKMAKNKKE
ncbi:MAG: hypothetical protein LBL58_12190 [Tannerellaceae bacterium]|jgi:hypothetical protein|nr:hypothetical protein [Tannerellaceae bacterium]